MQGVKVKLADSRSSLKVEGVSLNGNEEKVVPFTDAVKNAINLGVLTKVGLAILPNSNSVAKVESKKETSKTKEKVKGKGSLTT